MPSSLPSTLANALLALVFGFLGAAIWAYSGLGNGQTREYLVENPDILPEMAEAYQMQEASKRLADMGDDLYTPFPGAVMGNPEGSKVLVEFTDYNCGYCERSLADVTRLIAEDPEIKVVIREWPIFEGSDAPARMALAAAKQGKYAAFHEAMFEIGGTSQENIEAAATKADLDLEKARADAASNEVAAELARNLSLAQSLGFEGTPGWATKTSAIGGFVGFDRLKEALEEASAAEPS
ncbi:MAG: DsbA family protein [Erythrobacter sp.]